MSISNNSNLSNAKRVKNDEFYTQYADIEREMQAYLDYDENAFRGKTILLPCDDPDWSNFTKYFAQNFHFLGIKKLISTSYAHQSNPLGSDLKATTDSKGKVFTLTHDSNQDGMINLKWQHLKGDGDFRSDEIKALRDEADIIITNPPFSLFREFLAWVTEANKQFALIGSMNAITYKDVFPLIQHNQLWLGATNNGSDMVFEVPPDALVAPQDKEKAARLGYVGNYTRLGNSCWFTCLEHGRRHKPLALMTMADNQKFNTQIAKNLGAYKKYDNYDAIEVPKVNAIPSDYQGVMGVPITFLDKYCPEQFEIIGIDRYVADNPHYGRRFTLNGKETYARILIKHKTPTLS